MKEAIEVAGGNEQTIYLPLEAIESEHGASIVDRELSKLEGIRSHRVELNNKRAVISVRDNSAVTEAVKTITDLGYGVPTVKKTFPVLNMSCASCAVSAESTVKSVDGVLDASVNFATGNLVVNYLPGMTSPQILQHAVQEAGYDLLIDELDSGQDTLDRIHEEKYRLLKKKTILALILSAPVVAIGMFWMDMPFANEIMWALSTPVVLWLGRDFFINAWKQAKHRSANMDSLVALSTGTAYLFSVFNMLFPAFWNQRGLEAHVYFEAASVVIAFILLGRLLEEKAKGSASSAIKKLMGLQPKTVTRLRPDGSQENVEISVVTTGDLLLVKPGEKIAVDGTVTAGNSYVDESMLSGEPVPVLKKEDDKVFAGTINQKGSFQFRAMKVGKETMLAQIIKLVREAQGSKAPIQRLVDKVSSYFVPAVITIAIWAFVVWALGGLLGVHLLSLLLWLAGLAVGGRDAGGLLGRAWLALSSRLSRASETVDVTQALVGLLGPRRLLRWWLGAVTHGVWLAALVGAVVGLVVTLATRRYGFAWETTILPADVFVRAVRIVGWLPAQFGFAMPDADAVRASGDAALSGEAARIAWSSWLVGCVVAYGVVPRLLLAGVCFGLWRFGRSRLRLDVALPGYAVLVPRLMPASERIGVTDADRGRIPGPHVGGRRGAATGRSVLVALELAGQPGWPPPLPPGAIDAGVIDSREDRKKVVAALRVDPPARLLVACDARQSPDRGSLEVVAELSRHANDSRVLLVGAAQTGAGERRQHWHDGLRGIGMAPGRIDENSAHALEWLGAGEREDG
jgi:copper chaperone CopZ